MHVAATNTNDSKGVQIYIELVYSCYKLKPKSQIKEKILYKGLNKKT